MNKREKKKLEELLEEIAHLWATSGVATISEWQYTKFQAIARKTMGVLFDVLITAEVKEEMNNVVKKRINDRKERNKDE